MYPEGISTISIKDQVRSDFLALLIEFSEPTSSFLYLSDLYNFVFNSILILIIECIHLKQYNKTLCKLSVHRIFRVACRLASQG